MASEIISRSDAKAKGLSRYFTGKTCKNFHIELRITANGCCIGCVRETEGRSRKNNREKHQAKWRKASSDARKRNPEKIKSQSSCWSKNNRDKENAKKLRWRKANPEKNSDMERRYREAHPETLRTKNKIYKTLNAERLSPLNIARTKRWQAENPERAKANARKGRQHRRARILGSGGSYTEQEIQQLLEKQEWLCATVQCRASLRLSKELDHKIALARGGSNDITNLQWLCPRCNRKKQAKSPEEWALVCERIFPST